MVELVQVAVDTAIVLVQVAADTMLDTSNTGLFYHSSGLLIVRPIARQLRICKGLL